MKAKLRNIKLKSLKAKLEKSGSQKVMLANIKAKFEKKQNIASVVIFALILQKLGW